MVGTLVPTPFDLVLSTAGKAAGWRSCSQFPGENARSCICQDRFPWFSKEFGKFSKNAKGRQVIWRAVLESLEWIPPREREQRVRERHLSGSLAYPLKPGVLAHSINFLTQG